MIQRRSKLLCIIKIIISGGGNMTVKELCKLCEVEIENGNGDRDIVLCVNGDEFHSLENKFSSPVYNDSAIYDLLEEWEADEDSVIVLN